MTNTENVMRAMVILPELLRTIRVEYDLEPRETKYLMIIWAMSRSRLGVTTNELNEINKNYKSETARDMEKRGFLKLQKLEDKTRHLMYSLSPKGVVLINRINELSGTMLRRVVESIEA